MSSSINDLYLELLKNSLTASLYDESAWRVLEGGGALAKTSLSRPARLLKAVIRQWVLSLCSKRSLLLVQEQPFDPALREEGRDRPCFGYTMVGRRRLDNVQMCIENALRSNVPGDLIETGVWHGGTAIFMRGVLKAHGVTDRTVWVADSFKGFPVARGSKDAVDDLSQVEFLKVSLEQVRANFERFGLLDDQVRFLEGWFSDTLPNAPIERLAVLRLDSDLYTSTMDSLRSLYYRVSQGGYVIVDDYYSWSSCRQAVTDFLRQNEVNAQIQAIDWTGAYWKVERSPHDAAN